jgi:hypothetical protein
MKTVIKHYGWMENGKPHLSNKARYLEDCKNFPDCDFELTIKKRGKASSQSRRYYFGIIVREITTELRRIGNNVDEETVHELLKLECNKQYIRNADGEVIGEVGDTTTDHNPEERSEFIEACIQYAAEKLGLAISPPNTQTQLFAA